MRLANIGKKIKEAPDLPSDVFVLSLFVLIVFGAYMLGDTIQRENEAKQELRVRAPSSQKEGSGKGAVSLEEGTYVGSRNGKTYHLPWCSGAVRIREENKIWFASKQEAEARGYRPAGNCKGI